MRALLAKIATWIGAILAGVVLVGRIVLDLIGYSTSPEDAAGVPAKMHAVLNWIASQPWLAVYGVPTVLISIGVLTLWPHQHLPGGGKVADDLPKLRRKFIETDPTPLVAALKRIANDHISYVEISFAAAQHRPLADKLKAVFDLAGWNVTFNSGPLDNDSRHEFHAGIMMAGYNGAHLQVVVDTLKAAGLAVSGSQVRKLEVPSDNPKFPHAQRKVYIVIGHEC
jgi:hypothetical protein